MPHRAAVPEADIGAVLAAAVGQQQDLRVIGQDVFARRMHLERPEPAAELDMLLDGKMLVRKHQHEMPVPRRQHLVEFRIGYPPGQVEPAHLGAERLRKRCERERHVAAS